MHPPKPAEQFVNEQLVRENDVMSSVSIADTTDPFPSDKLIDCAVRERDAEEIVGEREMRGWVMLRLT